MPDSTTDPLAGTLETLEKEWRGLADAIDAGDWRVTRVSDAAAYRECASRLDAFRDIHERWEFDDFTEATFDAWLHQQIKAIRQHLASVKWPTVIPPAVSLEPWQPIETAPKQERILVYLPDPDDIGIVWGYQLDDGTWTEDETGCEISTPTHWMSLPAPPKLDAARAGQAKETADG